MQVTIRRGTLRDKSFLESISLSAKRYDKYTKEEMLYYSDRFNITDDYINDNIILVAEKENVIIAYCSIIESAPKMVIDVPLKDEGVWLDRIYIRPAYIHTGIGTRLMQEVTYYCQGNHITNLLIKCDQYAKGFFEKLGAMYIKEIDEKGGKVKEFLYQYQTIKPKETDIPILQKMKELGEEIGISQEEQQSLIETFNRIKENGIGVVEEAAVTTQQSNLVEEQKPEENKANEDKKNKTQKDKPQKDKLPKERLQKDKAQKDKLEKHELKENKSEKEKMLSGALYIEWGDELAEDKRRARKILMQLNHTDPEDRKIVEPLLRELFGSIKEGIFIEPEFRCSYGYNIHIGKNFYAGFNCVIVDNGLVKIGDNCILSPQVGIYTQAYPLKAEERVQGYEYTKPVIIGNNVWVGAGSIINPGVVIGDNVMIAPGSVVMEDIKEGQYVAGNPAKSIK